MTVLTRPRLEELWRLEGFSPNDNQRQAILHVDGPLYLPAGPGSGKTRVLLWRTVNLIVCHHVPPEEIYLSTFTEKAALQLKEGLRAYLGIATTLTGVPYDISKMYVGTVHSLCQRLIADRRFYANGEKGRVPVLLDELGQYFFLYRKSTWKYLADLAGLGDEADRAVNALFDKDSASHHLAVTNAIALFNRLSEECVDADALYERLQRENPSLAAAIQMYGFYKLLLQPPTGAPRVDFSLLQQAALTVLHDFDGAPHIFKHVIVDEYQDTNTAQERIFFRLAGGHKNICVVGDDDQALYRFRGATVENFVDFKQRCERTLGRVPTEIPLATNYRSRKRIVDFYTEFITQCDWSKNGRGPGFYRVMNKDIHAASHCECPSVVAAGPGPYADVCGEIADLVVRLLAEGKVEDPNQIAFLFPSLKSLGNMTKPVEHMKAALEARGLKVYAPRAGRFLEVDEAIDVLGVFLHIFGRPARGSLPGRDYAEYHDWLDVAYERGRDLIGADAHLRAFVAERHADLTRIVADDDILRGVAQARGWDLAAPYAPATMKRALVGATGLSEPARKTLASAFFDKVVLGHIRDGRPYPLTHIIRRATSLDWTILDLFYRLCGFDHFKAAFDLAEGGVDEGPICNLRLLSEYLARFIDAYVALLDADAVRDNRFVNQFFASYLFALFRRAESEYEDADDPFPRGRIPFLTIHQAKGLEFPVVVLGSLRKHNGVQKVEALVHDLLDRGGEPVGRQPEFDAMRLFYVALSRAKNLLVLAHFKGQGIQTHAALKTMLNDGLPGLAALDWPSLPSATLDKDPLPKTYSYTADYLLYTRCPRQYMIFRKYGLVPSHQQTMMFGTLVHRTLDDLHNFLKANGGAQP